MLFDFRYNDLLLDYTLEDAQDWLTKWFQYFDSFSDPKLMDWPLMSTPTGPLLILLLYFTIIFHGKKYIKRKEALSNDKREQDKNDEVQDEGIQEDDDQADDDDDDDNDDGNDNKQTKDGEKAKNDDGKGQDETSGGEQAKRQKEDNQKSDAQIGEKKSEFFLNDCRLFTAILLIYNCSISALNGWIAYELLVNSLENEYNFLCELVYPYTDDPHENRIAYAMWWYWASKGMELFDTLFIILKGKSNQLTFLHIYHHSSMFVVWWIGAKFVPGGSALSGAFVNCIVHVLMYLYYALSSFKCCKRILKPWKKRLTILQMIQFTIGIVLGLNSIITGCSFTRWMQYVFVAYAASFLILFLQFYVRTYRNKQSA